MDACPFFLCAGFTADPFRREPRRTSLLVSNSFIISTRQECNRALYSAFETRGRVEFSDDMRPIPASLLRVSIPSLANVCDLQSTPVPYKGSLEKNEESVAFLFNLLIKQSGKVCRDIGLFFFFFSTTFLVIG